MFFMLSCKKDHNVLGVDVQPSNDELNAENRSGLEVTAHSLPYDSIASFNSGYKYLGSNDDPYFGRTDIGLYLNPNITLTNLDFGVNSHVESAEIMLAISSTEFAGDQNAVLTYSVYPMENSLGVSEIYFTSDKRHHNASATPISVHTTSYTLSNAAPVIKINLDLTYAESILHDTANLKNNEVFQAKYKGYYIAANLQSGTEGAIYRANLDDDLSGLYLHYKTGSASTDTIIDFKFSFTGSTAARYNTVKFTPKQSLKDQFLDSTKGATDLYLKGMGMAKVKLQIPFLKNYSDSFKIAVNRAELILNAESLAGTGFYAAPPKLTLLSIDSLSRETYAQDLLNTTDNFRYDGTYDETAKRYVFNLAREAQLIFEGKKKNRGFYLVVANTDVTLNTIYALSSKELLPLRRDNYVERVILAGSNNTQLKPVFNLSFVRFKND